MYCEDCGAKLEDKATFCDECGYDVKKKDRTFKSTIKKYRIICGALAAVCLGLLAATLITLHEHRQYVESKESGKMVLYGVYVVGEDEELPAGRYTITPVNGKREIDITIYPSQESYDRERETNSWQEDTETLYRKKVSGYKLRKGNVVKIYDPGAVFQKDD